MNGEATSPPNNVAYLANLAEDDEDDNDLEYPIEHLGHIFIYSFPEHTLSTPNLILLPISGSQ
jgi:hypothetical protein